MCKCEHIDLSYFLLLENHELKMDKIVIKSKVLARISGKL